MALPGDGPSFQTPPFPPTHLLAQSGEGGLACGGGGSSSWVLKLLKHILRSQGLDRPELFDSLHETCRGFQSHSLPLAVPLLSALSWSEPQKLEHLPIVKAEARSRTVC